MLVPRSTSCTNPRRPRSPTQRVPTSDGEVVPSDGEIVTSDGEIVPSDGEVVPSDGTSLRGRACA